MNHVSPEKPTVNHEETNGTKDMDIEVRFWWTLPSCTFCVVPELQSFFVGDSAQEGDFNPVSANSDQDQFSPNNIHTLSTGKFWELTKWSPK